MNPRRDHYRDQDEVLSPVPLARCNTDSNREDEIAEGRNGVRYPTVCVCGFAISAPLWLPYGRMRGRVVEKNMRARRCIVCVSGGWFLSEGDRRRRCQVKR